MLLCVCVPLQALKTTYHQTSQYLEIDIGEGWGKGQRRARGQAWLVLGSAGQGWEGWGTGTGL